jgi:DNA-binding transcriptional ArsR family regulator
VAVRDLAEIAYGGDRSALERDLGYLEKKGIVTLRSVNARRDGSWRQPERDSGRHVDTAG